MGKYTETERKFLVTSDAWRDGAESVTPIVQAYIFNEPDRTMRVRKAGSRAFITVKTSRPGTIERFEWEIPVSAADADALLGQAVGGRIEKNRYRVPYEGHVWEVDEFLGDNAGLVVAEIELSSQDEEFALPRWAGKEVTSDPAYLNCNLAKKGTVSPEEL